MTSLVKRKLHEVSTMPLDVAVRTMVRAMFDAHAVDPALHRVLIEQVPRVGKLAQVVAVEREVGCLVQLFLEARRAELRRSDVDAVAFVLCHVVEAVTHAAVLAELDSVRSRAVESELTDMILRYLPAPRGGVHTG
jgi:hypothetical protein